MAKPYSEDLRESVKRAANDGRPHTEVAATFHIGIATVEALSGALAADG